MTFGWIVRRETTECCAPTASWWGEADCGYRMQKRVMRPRLIIALVLLLALIALVMGFIVPPSHSNAWGTQRDTRGATLVVSEFGRHESTLWLVSADDPASRTPFLRVAHAPGWELGGAVAPLGDRLALLTLPPSARAERTQAVLSVTDGVTTRVLTEALDLRGGLVWTADGMAILVRRTRMDAQGRTSFAIVEVDVATGSEHIRIERSDLFGLYAVGRPLDGPVYVVALSANGSDLLLLNGSGAVSAGRLSTGVTRDWTLSPDGVHLAYTEQAGLRLTARVIALGDAGRVAVREAAVADLTGGGSASPAWHPDGTLSIGTFGASPGPSPTLRVQTNGTAAGVDIQPDQGFTLPIAWSPDGTRLTVRAFSGSGPGAVGAESAAVVGPSGTAQVIPGTFIRVLGWWDGQG